MSETLTCTRCAATAPKPSRGLPRGWKTIAGSLGCQTCVRSGYVQRAIVVPIAGPIGATWPELGAALAASWATTTRLANWIATELYARDVRREAADTKLRPMPRVYLYPAARLQAPDLPAITIPTLLQQVERTYRARRYELLWTGAVSLPTYRYPMPLPLHRTQWDLTRTEGGMWICRVKIGDRWWDLRLRGGQDFARQRGYLEQLLSGTAEGAAGAIYRRVSHAGDRRGGQSSGLGQVRVLLKLVAWVPRVAAVTGDGVLQVETSGSDLLVCRQHGKGVTLSVDGQPIRRGIVAYETRRARLAETLSVARRFQPRERAGLLAKADQMARRQRDAITTQLQQTAAIVADHARRSRCATVRYDDSTDTFCGDYPFPWQQLRQAISHACESRGLTYEYEHAAAEALHLATGTADA